MPFIIFNSSQGIQLKKNFSYKVLKFHQQREIVDDSMQSLPQQLLVFRSVQFSSKLVFYTRNLGYFLLHPSHVKPPTHFDKI